MERAPYLIHWVIARSPFAQKDTVFPELELD